MSAITMHKTCIYCNRRYTYNPSVGRFGMVCPHCGKIQRTSCDHNKAERPCEEQSVVNIHKR